MPCIYVIAGTNGAGKSSIVGAMLLAKGAEYFDPDEAARRIQAANPGAGPNQVLGAAWREGKRLLERAIDERLDFAFETTLGGKTITSLLERALSKGIQVRIWYIGLRTPDLHVARVRSRVAKGGHDVSEWKIRERYESGRLNLVRLLPGLTALRVFDNSEESDPGGGVAPEPELVLHVERGRILYLADPARMPEWARPIAAAAMKRAE